MATEERVLCFERKLFEELGVFQGLSLDTEKYLPVVTSPSKILYLPAIKEKVPVFEGTFRIRQELKVNSMAEFSSTLSADGIKVAINGTLEYQACDSSTCFLPTSVPVAWGLWIVPLDRQRAPEDIRHK